MTISVGIKSLNCNFSRKEIVGEIQISAKAKQEAQQMNLNKSEFLELRGFWFFFPEKKNKNVYCGRGKNLGWESIGIRFS